MARINPWSRTRDYVLRPVIRNWPYQNTNWLAACFFDCRKRAIRNRIRNLKNLAVWTLRILADFPDSKYIAVSVICKARNLYIQLSWPCTTGCANSTCFFGFLTETVEKMSCYNSLSEHLRDLKTPTIEDVLDEFLREVRQIHGRLLIVRSSLRSLSFLAGLQTITGNPDAGIHP